MQTLATRYERGPRLGGGAMGEVFLARDVRSGASVALKLLHGPIDDDLLARRFQREVDLQSRVQHRAVPRVLDHGVDETGAPWLAMERVEGRTLAEVLDQIRAHRERGVVSIDRTWLLRTFVRVCRVVEHAHRRGIVHRDLKPENVMVDIDGEVHVLDWGLAGLVGERPEAPRGIVLGTPGYIAPENARGDGAAARTSGDVFALGALLFELLALEPLYPQRHPLARLTAVLLEGDPLGDRMLGWPPALESIVRCATAREASARFASAEALALAVEMALAPATRPPFRAKLGLAAAAAMGLLALSPVAAKAEPVVDAACDGMRTVAVALASIEPRR